MRNSGLYFDLRRLVWRLAGENPGGGNPENPGGGDPGTGNPGTPGTPGSPIATLNALDTQRYGPQGIYWAPKTPVMTTSFTKTIVVDASWSAIASAIKSINDESTTSNARILVNPGVLADGKGDGSGATGVLDGVGTTARTKPILIAPKSGLGSVTVAGTTGVAITKSAGFAIMGIDFGQRGLMIRNCTDVIIGYTQAKTANMTANNSLNLLRCGYVEVSVDEERHAYNGDRGAARLSDPSTITDCFLIGCYFSPGYRATGSTAHNDSFQLSATGRTLDSGFRFIDCVVFNSSNQGVIFTETPHVQGVVMDKLLIISGYDKMGPRHPADAGDDTPEGTNALWGGGQTMTIKNSIVIGSTAAANQFDLVQNTRVSLATSSPVKSGSFTVDASLRTVSQTQINAWSERPNAAWRARVWGPVFPKISV